MRISAQPSLIEPLEARIAPAAVTLYASLYTDHKTQNGKTLQFINTAAAGLSAQDQAIVSVIGANPNVYFIRMSAGEDLQMQTNVGYTDIVNVSAGNIVAFFTDLNGDHTIDPNELTGLALGNKVSVAIGTDVNGDIVTNYNDATGILGGTTENPGLAHDLLPNQITSLTVAGNVGGAVISGGNILKFSDSGNLHQMLTGTAGNGYTYDFTEGTTVGGQNLIVGTPAAKTAGPSISNVVIGSLDSAPFGMLTGNGGPGGAGGSISHVTVFNDTDGFTIQTGVGGAGTALSPAGGKGGSINGVIVEGAAANSSDPTPNSLFQFIAGIGGGGFAAGNGGAGGAVQNIYFDYTAANASAFSPTPLQDDVLIQGGNGGAGVSGGAGGALTGIHILSLAPHDLTLGAVEFQVLAGTGGNATTGHAGAGGAITTLDLRDLASPVPDAATGGNLPDDTAATSPTLVLSQIVGGAGGIVTGLTGTGGAGGAVTGLTLKGFDFQISGGAGGTGPTHGGAGGSISTLSVLGSLASIPGDNIHVQDLQIHPGDGANATAGTGGVGGKLTGVLISNADFGDPTLVNGGLQITTGKGGDSGKGTGAAAGSISNVQVVDTDFATVLHPMGHTGAVTVATGAGGDGSTAGGMGGSISNMTIIGTRLEIGGVTTGNGGKGGSNAVAGRGGAAGSMSGVTINTSEGVVNDATQGAETQLLLDTTQDFSTVAVGDLVTDTSNNATAAVISVDAMDHELIVNSPIFSTGDAYSVAAPTVLTGSGLYFTSKIGGLLLDTTQNFSTVKTGDTVNDTTNSESTTVLGVDAADHELILADKIFSTGDGYSVDALSGTAQDTGNTLADAATNFLTAGVTVGDTANDLAQSSFGAATADVTAVSAHVLTLSRDVSFFFTSGDAYTVNTHGSLTAGTGGNGNVTGNGGAGGGIVNSSVVVDGMIHIAAGNGGAGGTTGPNSTGGAAGAGGSLTGVGAFNNYSLVSLSAGNAGAAGTKAGAGGSISGANVQALSDVSITAGDGFAGGAGGSIRGSGFAGPVPPLSSGYSPNGGNVTVKAGDGGSNVAGAGGAGGSITTLTGFVSNGDFDFTQSFTNQFTAGKGGNGTTKGGAGGSLSGIDFFGGGGFNVTFALDAGDAGSATTAATGATGGSVNGVAVGAEPASTGADAGFTLDTNTIFHHISAGDGGATALATGKGGAGGSVSNVHVNGAIGLRTGAEFGFSGGFLIDTTQTFAGINVGDTVTDTTTNKTTTVVAVDGADNRLALAANILSKGDGYTVDAVTSTATGAGGSMGGISAGAGGVGGASNGKAGNVSAVTADAISSIVAGHHVSVGSALTISNLATTVNGVILNGTTPPAPVQRLPFTLTFNGNTTPTLSGTATTSDVSNALNSLASVNAAGGVVVTKTNNGGFLVTFQVDGTEPAMTGFEYSTVGVHEVVTGIAANPPATPGTQEVEDVTVMGLGAFTLTIDGVTTGQIPATATPAQVETVLNNLMTSAVPPAAVIPGGVTVTQGTSSTEYVITFNDVGPQGLFTGTENIPLTIGNTAGTGSTVATDTIAFPVQSFLDPTAFSAANLVGGIADLNAPNPLAFKYTNYPTAFAFGDSPIDGLVAALTLTANKNFVPEAFVTADASNNAVLVDNVNN